MLQGEVTHLYILYTLYVIIIIMCNVCNIYRCSSEEVEVGTRCFGGIRLTNLMLQLLFSKQKGLIILMYSLLLHNTNRARSSTFADVILIRDNYYHV